MDRARVLDQPPPGIVFSDLDGTLLDHDTYDFRPALPAVAALRRAGVPLALCSSKTRAEILEIQGRLDLVGPFIAENGGAVMASGKGPLAGVFPDRVGDLPGKVLGTAYSELRTALSQCRGELRLPMRGFGDATIEEVAEWTGLDVGGARLAKQRDFDEPFLWEPEPRPGEVERVRSWLAARSLQLSRGGRFWHLTGPNDKGRAVHWLLQAARKLWGVRLASLALGDSENDLPMLEEVDEGILVERPGGGHLSNPPPGLRLVGGVGPVGWNRAVLGWLATVLVRTA